VLCTLELSKAASPANSSEKSLGSGQSNQGEHHNSFLHETMFFYHSNASLFLFFKFSWYTMSVQCTDSANLDVDMVFSTIPIITVLKMRLKLIVKKTTLHFSTLDFAGRA
jgi:hypothetical protein